MSLQSYQDCEYVPSPQEHFPSAILKSTIFEIGPVACVWGSHRQHIGSMNGYQEDDAGERYPSGVPGRRLAEGWMVPALAWPA